MTVLTLVVLVHIKRRRAMVIRRTADVKLVPWARRPGDAGTTSGKPSVQPQRPFTAASDSTSADSVRDRDGPRPGPFSAKSDNVQTATSTSRGSSSVRPGRDSPSLRSPDTGASGGGKRAPWDGRDSPAGSRLVVAAAAAAESPRVVRKVPTMDYRMVVCSSPASRGRAAGTSSPMNAHVVKVQPRAATEQVDNGWF